MKTLGIVALVAAVAVIAFAAGSNLGMGGMLIMMMSGMVLSIGVPIALAVIAVLAAGFWFSARANNTKPRWGLFLKVSGGLLALTCVICVIVAVNAMMNWHP